MYMYIRTKDQIVESVGNSNQPGICQVIYSTDRRNVIAQK